MNHFSTQIVMEEPEELPRSQVSQSIFLLTVLCDMDHNLLRKCKVQIKEVQTRQRNPNKSINRSESMIEKRNAKSVKLKLICKASAMRLEEKQARSPAVPICMMTERPANKELVLPLIAPTSLSRVETVVKKRPKLRRKPYRKAYITAVNKSLNDCMEVEVAINQLAENYGNIIE